MESVIHDLNILKAAEDLGLLLNKSKPEIICIDDAGKGIHITALLGAIVVNPESTFLLGSPLDEVASIRPFSTTMQIKPNPESV